MSLHLLLSKSIGILLLIIDAENEEPIAVLTVLFTDTIFLRLLYKIKVLHNDFLSITMSTAPLFNFELTRPILHGFIP